MLRRQFAVAVLAPFATGAVDHRAYIANILLMPGQELLWDAILQSLALGAAICALPAVAFARIGATAEERVLFAGLILCTLVAAILSGKPGGGTPYLLPFIPLAVILAGRAAASG